MRKIKSIVSVIVFAVFLATVSVVCFAKPADATSDAERRELAQFPEATLQTMTTGEFSENFARYTTDQFPAREPLRGLKTFVVKYLLQKAENNGIFTAEGHISKIDGEENPAMLDRAGERMMYLYNTYLKESYVYFSIVPDKNRYLASQNGYPSMDYDGFVERMRTRIKHMGYIDVSGLLSLDDYYRTDTHWKQENIVDIARHLSTEMGALPDNTPYTENTLDVPFNGVYSGQYALPAVPDTIKYLTSDAINNAVVKYYDTGMAKDGAMYNMEKAYGKDPYEMFLSGTMPLATLERTDGVKGNHLILFRDSFGSAIAPLFLESYDKVTVIDTRYVQSQFLKNFGIEFSGADVLFLYSTSLLNNSLAMR